MRKSFNINIYGDETLKAKYEHVKQYYMDKNPGMPLSESATGGLMIDDLYQKIVGRETNANRITTIIERLDSLEGTVDEKLSALTSIIKELVETMKGEGDDDLSAPGS